MCTKVDDLDDLELLILRSNVWSLATVLLA